MSRPAPKLTLKRLPHKLPGAPDKVHWEGSGFLDFTTLCGSCWDEGEFIETDALVDCVGCNGLAWMILDAARPARKR